MLTIQLFGEFQLTVNGVVTALKQTRLQSLLAYLLLHRHAAHSRQQLAFHFWPDSSEAQARANLRQLLHYLHQALPADQPFLRHDNKTVQWNAAAAYRLDVADFAAELAQAAAAEKSGQPATVIAALVAAVNHYRGDLLPACYDDWILPERERWRTQFIMALEKLRLLLEAQRAYDQAILYAQRLLHHDPLHESTYRDLMRLYAANGDRVNALRTYHTCVTNLQRELGVEPHPTTQEAYRRLLDLELPPAASDSGPAPLTATVRLVGRQTEWAQLQAAWRRAAQGRAHFVLVTGEAGMGKTRLVEELRYWAEQQGIATAHTRSYAAEGDLAYAPVIEWLRSPVCQSALPHLPMVWRSEVARLLPELLTQQPNLLSPLPAPERQQRQRLFEALARTVLLVKPPLLLTLDDLQWCDRETIEWLHYLLRFDPRARLLLVGTARPEEVGTEHPLTALLLHLQRAEQVTELALGPLDPAETAQLAVQAAGQAVADTTLARLVQFTEGNPLFVVETMRVQNSTWLAGSNPIASNAIAPLDRQSLPPKIQAVIQERLQQLSPDAREIAKLAAVSGRAFTFALLARASELSEAALARGLDELWQRRIVREASADAYDFSHDRLRDGAYSAISPIQRRYLHKQVAQALEELHAAQLDPVSAQIAVHCERAGMTAQAIAYYQRAAAVEAAVFSYSNAITYLDAALRLLNGQPQTTANTQQAVTLLLNKGRGIERNQGFTVTAMVELCAELEARLPYLTDDRLALQVHQRLRNFYGASGQAERSLQQADALLTLSHRLTEPIYQLAACQSLGTAHLQLGHFVLARQAMEQGLAYYRTSAADNNTTSQRDNAASGILGNLTLTLWVLGYPDQAVAQTTALVNFVEKLGDPWRVSVALFFVSMINSYLYNAAATAAAAEQMLALDQQYGMAINRGSGLVPLGWAWALQERLRDGIDHIRAGIDDMKAMNHTMFQTHRLAWLIEAQMWADDWTTAAATLDEAFTMSAQSGQRSCDAELYRLRGEWLAHAVAEAEAEGAFWQAIELARTQAAKSFELRAVLSLCRLWQRQGKRVEAYQLLAAIYDWFSEGFATADLQGAKSLLTELS